MWGLEGVRRAAPGLGMVAGIAVLASNAAAQEPEAPPAEAVPAPAPEPQPPSPGYGAQPYAPPAYGPYAQPPPYGPPPLPPPEPAEPGKNQTSGLAIGAGAGYQFAVLGAQLIYYIQLADSVRIAPYGGGGVWPSELGTFYGYAFGMMASFGGRHRGLIDVSYGLAGIEGVKNVLEDTVLESESLYGVTIAGGYEFMADGGFFVRPSAGVTILTTETRFSDTKASPTFNIALGYKLF
jgi:hypothetical protein